MDERSRQLRLAARIWEFNARADALWAILTAKDRSDRRWQEGEFFSTGVAVTDRILGRCAALGMTPARGRALDFGCGVGRLTQALAASFAEVVGVDVSPTMIDKARAYDRRPGRIRYVWNAEANIGFVADRTMDFVLSVIVLQHIPAPLSLTYVDELVRILAPGGVLVFQLPTRPLAPEPPTFRSWLKSRLPAPLVQAIRERLHPRHPVTPMHVVPRATIEARLAAHGDLRVVAEPDDLATGYESFTYHVQRARDGGDRRAPP